MTGCLKSLISINRDVFSNVGFLDKLYLIGLLLMPVDSFPIFPTSNVYRPISFFPILMYWILMCLSRLKFNRKDGKLFLLLVAAIIYTLFISVFIHQDLSGMYKFILNGLISFIFIAATRIFILRLIDLRVPVMEFLAKVLILATLLPITIGWMQFLGRIGVFPSQLAISITELFSYRVDISRIQWLSGEPAMGFRFISLSLLFTLLYYDEDKVFKRLIIISSVALLALSGSTFGYFFILLTAIFYYVFFQRLNIKHIVGGALIIGLASVTLIFTFESLPAYTKGRLLNIFNLFSNLNLNNFIALASIDGSFFLRIFNPIIGFIMCIENYGLGIGGECFHYQYIEIVEKYFPFALNFESVQQVLYGESIITPKSLYSKIISEFGIIGLSSFLFLLWKLYKRIQLRKNRRLAWLFCFLCMMIVNSDSYIYFNFLFLLILLIEVLLIKIEDSQIKEIC